MKKLLLLIICLCVIPVKATALDFFGGLYRLSVNSPLTVTWDPQTDADGFQLKIVHYFYTGLETQIVETTGNTYVFQKMPKSSRHFEIRVRAYNEDAVTGTRSYSEWSLSTDAQRSLIDSVPGGWLIYTYPGAPSF